MKTKNARRLVIVLGVVQIITALGLALGAASFYWTYGNTAAQLASDGRETISLVSKLVRTMAQRADQEKATIQAAVKALGDRQLLLDMSKVLEQQEKQLPLYARDLRSAGVLVSRTGVQFANLKSPLEFSIPRFKGWEGGRPVFDSTQPLSKEAATLGEIGKDLQNLGLGLQRAADDIEKHGESLRKSLATSLKRSEELLQALEVSLQRIEKSDVPQLSDNLTTVAETLERASQHASLISDAVTAISILGLLLGILFFCNAVITIASMKAIDQQ